MQLVDWDRQGRSILFSSDRGGSVDLWRVPFGVGGVHGNPEVAKANIGNIDFFASSRQGALFFISWGGSTDINVAGFDWKSGALMSTPVRANSRNIGGSSSPAWSPDGRHLAFLASRIPGQREFGKLCIWSQADGGLREHILKYPLLDG